MTELELESEMAKKLSLSDFLTMLEYSANDVSYQKVDMNLGKLEEYKKKMSPEFHSDLLFSICRVWVDKFSNQKDQIQAALASCSSLYKSGLKDGELLYRLYKSLLMQIHKTVKV